MCVLPRLIRLYSESPIATMKGHQERICRVAFHPSGNYVASASFDTTWRLWDVATTQELLLQEGHSKEVYSVEFQDDGALAASGSVTILPTYNIDLTILQRFGRDRTCVGFENGSNSDGT